MCGVAGIFNYADPERAVDASLLERMTRALQHRGPDDEGIHLEGPVGLGHRRLSIVDLSPSGRQPMSTADGRRWISYNGEFYNHRQFRDRLAGRGCAFKGTSDTETLLYLLTEFGPRSLEDAAGIFAFAYWDDESKRLLLARDPLGVKQLYYHDDGRRLLFASEIKALLEAPSVPRDLDVEALNEYLHFHTPLFDRTFFRGIRQVRPGEFIEIGRNGLRRRTYWQPTGFEPRTGSDQDEITALRNLIESVVGEQLMSDVPVGAFFSGGIDSSAVASFARRIAPGIHCFGVHFTEPGVIDERPYQEAAAKALGVELDLITVDPESFPEDMIKLSYFQDAPVIGAAMVPMYYVSRLASRRVKVCLGGQAADEIFGGYARYALTEPIHVLRGWLNRRPGSQSASEQASARVGGNLFKQLVDLRNARRALSAARHLTSWRERYFDHVANVPEKQWRRIFPDPSVFARRRARDVFEAVVDASPAEHPADKVMHWDVQTYLTGLFQQDDRMSMASGLESRVPLADPRLVRFAFHTSFDRKFRGGASKWILREAVSDVLPEIVLNRRKVGFDTPAERWMKERHGGFVRDLLLSSRARARGFWDSVEIERLLNSPTEPLWFERVWKLASIEAWATVFLDGRVPSFSESPQHAA